MYTLGRTIHLELYQDEMAREVGGKLGECRKESPRKRSTLLDAVEIQQILVLLPPSKISYMLKCVFCLSKYRGHRETQLSRFGEMMGAESIISASSKGSV